MKLMKLHSLQWVRLGLVGLGWDRSNLVRLS
jgi:hypothetical protein